MHGLVPVMGHKDVHQRETGTLARGLAAHLEHKGARKCETSALACEPVATQYNNGHKLAHKHETRVLAHELATRARTSARQVRLRASWLPQWATKTRTSARQAHLCTG